jgi:sulfur-oxidizing protein SoxX
MKGQLLTAILAASLLTPVASADTIEKGKQIAWDRKKGNCLTCHMFEGGQQTGNVGPPMVAMKARFPERKALVEYIKDPTKRNPLTAMPPFGRNKILTEQEINLVVDYLYTL